MDTGDPKSNVQELEIILAAMAQAIVHYDHSRAAIRANPAARDLFGFDPVGLDWYELVESTGLRNPDGSPVPREEMPIERALNGETITGMNFDMVGPQGEERLVRASLSPLAREKTVTGIIAVWQDVSEREQLVEQLEIEQSRLETMIENAPEGIIVADEEGRLVRGNPAAEQLLGKPLPVGKDYEHLHEMHICYENGAPYDPRYLPLVCSALDGERMNNIELLVVLPDNQVRWLSCSTAPIIDRKGNLNGAVGILQDITGRKHSEKELQSQAGRSSLLASLSHAFAEAGLNYQELVETIVMQIEKTLGECCRLEVSPDDSLSPSPDTTAGCDPPEPLESPVKLHVPLHAHGRNIGAMEIIRSQPGSPFSEEDRAFFHDLADRAALAIDDAQLYEREMRRARELDALNQAMEALLSTIDLENLLASFAATATAALQNATLYKEVERLATVDAVTGQYNRHKLIELGELEIRRFHRLKIPLAAIMLDLDNFKNINDTFGHGTGDHALHAVAQRCRASIRVIDILGRYGGDEFAILLPYANLVEAKEIAGRIRLAVISDPLHIQNIEVSVTISLGVTQAVHETRNFSDLMGRADTALYQAKQSGKNSISIVE